MAGVRVHVVVPGPLLERVDVAAAAVGVSRGEFVRRAVERALEGGPDDDGRLRVRVPASASAQEPVGEGDPVSEGEGARSPVPDSGLSRVEAFRRATQRGGGA